MLNVLRRGHAAFQQETVTPGWRPDDDVVWIDLLHPTKEEELAVEAALGLELPTSAEMEALEPSSRLYQEAGATFMTATLLAKGDEPTPVPTPATFVLAGGRLITLRYEQLRAFSVYSGRAHSLGAATGAAALLGLLDAIVERLAQVLDASGHRVETASQIVLGRPQSGDFRPLLAQLAQTQSVTALTRTSLVGIGRVVGFAALSAEVARDPECRAHLDSLHHDVQSLTDHAGHQSGHIAFLLDAALGLISIEQNSIIKVLSIVALVFTPPTLIASVYGMNFEHLPELHLLYGYPLALLAMLLTMVLPLVWLRRRGWL